MKKHEPRKHHYIPRFILKNFNDENKQVNYWNIENNRLEKRNIKSVFMNINMYRDENLNADDPTQIESKFSFFESEIADLIQNKILNKNEIILKRNELEKLRIFITLLSFRSNHRMEQYKNNKFDTSTRDTLLKYQPDGDFEKLWKRELDVLTTCRSYDEIRNSEIIDPIIKLDFENDLTGLYMTFVDARGGQFILSDIYPTLEIYPLVEGNVNLHFVLPLSPTRMLLLNNIMFKKEILNEPHFKDMINLSKIKGNCIITPQNKLSKVERINDEYIYKVRKIYANDVQYLNSLILNEAKVGIIFRDAEKIINSISKFNEIKNTKQLFVNFENELKNYKKTIN